MKEFKNIESKIGNIFSKENINNNNVYKSERMGSKEKIIIKKKEIAPKHKANSSNQLPKIKKKQIKKENEEENIFALVGSDNEEEEIGRGEKLKEETIQKGIVIDPKIKVVTKGPTPKSNEINQLKPKEKKNYILENKTKVTQNEIPSKVAKKEEIETAIHKDFGKTPDYLQKYKQEAEEKKLNEKRKLEEAKYPKGTRLLPEDERVQTLNSLLDSRKEIQNLIEKMPITMRSKAVQNRKDELENKLAELDEAIIKFSKKQVFIKSD